MSYASARQGFTSERIFLREWTTKVDVQNYEWLLSGKTVSSKDFITVTVEAKLESRYSFLDDVQLRVDVISNYQTKVAEKVFELRKISQLQSFDFQISKEDFNLDDSCNLTIAAWLCVVPCNYYSKDPVTIAQLRNPSTPHDIVLTVGLKSYYLQKSYLAKWSRFFANYFKQKPDIKPLDLNEFSLFSTYFELLLQSIYPGVRPNVTDLTFPLLISLAIRFEVPAVLNKCEPYWEKYNREVLDHLKDPVKNKPCSSAFVNDEVFLEHLIMADRYSLPQLQLTCFFHYKNVMTELEQEDFLEEQKKKFGQLSLKTIHNMFNFPTNSFISTQMFISKNMMSIVPKLNEPELTDPARKHDVVICVEDQQFCLNKKYLSIWSNYFEKMFSSSFKEHNQDTIILEEVNSEEFRVLLKLIYPSAERNVISDENVLFLMKLADRFEMMSVIGLCENNLLNCVNERNLIELLALSDEYNLANLQVCCLKILHNMNGKAFKQFLDQHRDVIKEFSKNTLANLI